MANGSTETQFRLIRNFKDANGMFRKKGKKASWTWYPYEILKFKGHVFDLGSGKVTPMKACGKEDKALIDLVGAADTGIDHDMNAELAYQIMIKAISEIKSPEVMILATGNWRASRFEDRWVKLTELFEKHRKPDGTLVIPGKDR